MSDSDADYEGGWYRAEIERLKRNMVAIATQRNEARAALAQHHDGFAYCALCAPPDPGRLADLPTFDGHDCTWSTCPPNLPPADPALMDHTSGASSEKRVLGEVALALGLVISICVSIALLLAWHQATP